MEQRVSLITLGVADLERSSEFYERLGWRRSWPRLKESYSSKQEGWPSLCTRETNSQRNAKIAPEGHGFDGVSIGYNTALVKK